MAGALRIATLCCGCHGGCYPPSTSLAGPSLAFCPQEQEKKDVSKVRRDDPDEWEEKRQKVAPNSCTKIESPELEVNELHTHLADSSRCGWPPRQIAGREGQGGLMNACS